MTREGQAGAQACGQELANPKFLRSALYHPVHKKTTASLFVHIPSLLRKAVENAIQIRPKAVLEFAGRVFIQIRTSLLTRSLTLPGFAVHQRLMFCFMLFLAIAKWLCQLLGGKLPPSGYISPASEESPVAKGICSVCF